MPVSRLRAIAGARTTLKRLGEVRDGLLVVGAALYGLGFAAWAIYSWSNELGPVSGLDVQYFIAGIPAILVFGVGWRISIEVPRFYREVWPTWFQSLHLWKQRLVSVALTAVMLACLAYLNLRPATFYKSFGRDAFDVAVLFNVFVAIGASAVTLLLFTRRRPLALAPHATRLISVLRVYVVIFVAFLVLGYFRYLYPVLPQTLGGGAPRSAVVDIHVDKVSPATIAELCGRQASPAEQVVRSVRLDVYQTTAQSLVVVRPSAERGKPRTLIELKQDSVSAVSWLP